MRTNKKLFHGFSGSAALLASLLCLVTPGIALAYVGPGAGISMLGALWGLIVGVVMALGVILFWPIRMMIRKAKAKKATAAAENGTATQAAANDSNTSEEQPPTS